VVSGFYAPILGFVIEQIRIQGYVLKKERAKVIGDPLIV